MPDIDLWRASVDFRAEERCLQWLLQASHPQVASRLLLQTRQFQDPTLHRWVQRLRQKAWTLLYQDLLAERKTYGYPPYGRLLRLVLRHDKLPYLEAAAAHLGQHLQAALASLAHPCTLLGPHPAPLQTRPTHRLACSVKLPLLRAAALAAAKAHLQRQVRSWQATAPYRGVQLTWDVDPA